MRGSIDDLALMVAGAPPAQGALLAQQQSYPQQGVDECHDITDDSYDGKNTDDDRGSLGTATELPSTRCG